MRDQQHYPGLDAFRLIAAILVIANHTSPLASFHPDIDFFLTRILARVAVPFFFMVSGHFILTDLMQNRPAASRRVLCYLKKLCLLYAAAILLYFPVGIYAGHYEELTFSGALKMLFFDGTFYHLWYFPACILGILLIYGLSRFMPLPAMTAATGGLYLFGLFGDSYFGLIQDLPVLSTLYSFVFRFCSYTRNGLFFAPIFLLLGVWVGRQKNACSPKWSVTGLACSFAFMTVEGFVLHAHGLPRHDSMYFMLIPVMFFLYQLLLVLRIPFPRTARSLSTWIYILHPAMILLVRALGKLLHLTTLLVEQSLVHFLMVSLFTITVSCILVKIVPKFKNNEFAQGRAWIELDRAALEHNVRFLQSQLPKECRLMAAVKANAYGHGAVLISRELNKLGLRSFCVADVTEGIELRKKGVRGTILILGYTHETQFHLLRRYHLTQTVVDYEHAQTLNRYGQKVHVHVAVDTGMHRLGERSDHTAHIKSIFDMKNLVIDGLFTHLSASDSYDPESRAFTAKQAAAFDRLITILKEDGYPIPKLHLQASYGVLNYPYLAKDYARVGIALYGVPSTTETSAQVANSLKPVLSLKARVALVRTLCPMESVGYSMAFTARQKMKIAVLTIGYADGLPRSLSNGVGSVLLHGQKAPILGRICMDQTIVDVSGIPDVQAGDIATIIGKNGEQTIPATDWAEQTGSITNEVLSRLGPRLKRLFL